MSFWVQHGLHLALVVVPSSAMGAGLAVERRKGVQERQASAEETVCGPAASDLPAAIGGSGPAHAIAPTIAPAIARPDLAPAGTALTGSRWALPAVAIGATGAALTHLVVMPEHFKESLLYGTFFLVAAVLQVAWAAVVAYRPTRAVLVAGAAGCAATMLLWLVSRTVGIPTAVGGIGGGAPEAVGSLDVLATAFEALAVSGVIVALCGPNLVGGSPSRWPLAARAAGVTALCGTAALAFWAPVT